MVSLPKIYFHGSDDVFYNWLFSCFYRFYTSKHAQHDRIKNKVEYECKGNKQIHFRGFYSGSSANLDSRVFVQICVGKSNNIRGNFAIRDRYFSTFINVFL